MANKNFTEVKFFLKNTETTAAFTKLFKGGTSPYPLEDFSDITGSSVGQYEVISPIFLGKGYFGDVMSPNNNQLDNDGDFDFTDSFSGYTPTVGDYILFDNGTDGDANLQVLGKINAINSVSLITFDKIPTATNTSDTSGGGGTVYKNIYLFPKSVAGNSFLPGDNFYLVVKNPDYVSASGNHDAVLNINTAVTTPTADVFAYGTNRTANPTYFRTTQISQNAVVDAGLNTMELSVQTNIASKITAVSTYAQGSTTVGPINLDSIPYWSVYEVNPYGDTSSVFNKQTFYKIQIDESLPAKQITLVTGGE
jgi:hypothetical protein